MSQKTVPIRETENKNSTEIDEPSMTIEKALRVIGYTIIAVQMLIIATVAVMFPGILF